MATAPQDQETDLQLLGLVGLADPPRQEAIEAERRARAAGMDIVMITRDHPHTALAIGRELGIVLADEDPAQWIHARATPEDKPKIGAAWRWRGAVVAMTGDGVNDRRRWSRLTSASPRTCSVRLAMNARSDTTRPLPPAPLVRARSTAVASPVAMTCRSRPGAAQPGHRGKPAASG